MPHASCRMPLVIAAAIALSMSCARTPVAPPMTAASGPRISLPDGSTVAVEIAANDETRAQGLMYRDQLREGTGMLFLFPATGDYPFWMKSTLIPLDMVWIDENRKVVHVASDVPPCQADPEKWGNAANTITRLAASS